MTARNVLRRLEEFRLSRKLSIVTGWNFTRAYGTLGYLGAALVERGFDVEIVGRVPSGSLPELDVLPFPAWSWYARWYGRIPRLRYPFAEREIASWLERRGGAILNTDLHFFNLATRFKRAGPTRRWIQMCYELQLPEEYPGERNMDLSVDRTVEPDLWIDVEPNRARVRSERLGLPTPFVLPNTLPGNAMPGAGPQGALARLAGGDLPNDRPVLLYVGSASIGRSLPRVVEALGKAQSRPFFLAFIHGNESERGRIDAAFRSSMGPENARVCSPVPRKALLGAMREASAGLVYYPHSDEPTLNHLYCAPQKAYEYLGAGLPVVSSANPSMRELLLPKGLGAAAEDDSAEALARAIDLVLRDVPTPDEHRRIEGTFRGELCFERVSPPVLDAIEALLD